MTVPSAPAPGGPQALVGSWGRLSRDAHQLQPLRDRSSLQLASPGPGHALPFGNGRSYGDVCLNPGGRLWTTRTLDRFIDFDPTTGLIECEAGVLLDEILALALPRGWFLPVTPGTRYATLGGALANDVHGKNHHRAGTLGQHLHSLVLARSDGSRFECSATQRPEWLRATLGGMGLTGLIVSARLQLMAVPGAWMNTEALAFDSLDGFFALSGQSERDWQYTVSWVDCVHGSGDPARGILFRGNHAADDRPQPAPRTRSVPLAPPVSLVNRATLRAFNALYFATQRRRSGPRLQALNPFFYPLDGVRDWNRIYGPRGFYQYQCVVPRPVEREATAALLRAIGTSGRGSFLAVLKTFGDHASAGLMSFPMAGTTLALDFPNEGAATLALFDRLDAIVGEAGGRLYPAKDARMGRPLFERGYPRLAEFLPFRDPGISSALSRRLIGE